MEKIKSKLSDNTNLVFWLLLVYSLLPGIGKIFGQQLIMLGALPIIVLLISRNRTTISLYRFDLMFVFFIAYLFLLTCLCLTVLPSNKLGVCMAIFLNILPMLGYLYSRQLSFDDFCNIIIKIISVHCVIGILLYPPFGIVSQSSPFVEPIMEGVAFGRMASVSGSLGFGNLIMTGTLIAVFKERRYLPLIIFCWLFSGQRSAWLGGVFGIFIMLYYNLKKGKLLATIKYVFLFVLFVSVLYVIVSSVLKIDLDFIFGRMAEFGDATSERDEQWVNGWNNFKTIPIGGGPGQVGQIASRYEGGGMSGLKIVPDGDYFRIFSEYGIGGMFFYIGILFTFLISLLHKVHNVNHRLIIAIVGGNTLQMIGSNITEFYFTNFIYWTILGYFFLVANSLFKISSSKHDKCMCGHI